MATNATTFGAQAGTYAAARPAYPDALFDWLAARAPGRRLAWDVGTGSGQAAGALAERFERVHATDLDTDQIAAAPPHPRVAYRVAPAEASGLSDAAADAVTVATALHWFDRPAFWREVGRVATPGALFAAWTYHRIEADAALDDRLIRPVLAVIDPYWSAGNRLSWRGYDAGELGFPGEVLGAPRFACALRWTPAQVATFVRSWSAHLRARRDGHAEALARIEADALAALGTAPRSIRLPLHLLAGRLA